MTDPKESGSSSTGLVDRLKKYGFLKVKPEEVISELDRLKERIEDRERLIEFHEAQATRLNNALLTSRTAAAEATVQGLLTEAVGLISLVRYGDIGYVCADVMTKLEAFMDKMRAHYNIASLPTDIVPDKISGEKDGGGTPGWPK